MTGTPTIEVLFVLYRSAETIQQAIASLKRIGPEVSVAFHDNSPSGESLPVALEAARRYGIPARGEICESNCGFGQGCNALAFTSSAQWLLFLNPDAEILEWPAYLPGPTDDDVVGPRVQTEPGATTITWGRRPVLVAEAARRLPLLGRVAVPWMARQPQADRGVDYLSGVALLIPTHLFRHLGGFDPRFFMYYEDVDLTLRAKDGGSAVRVDPHWTISHIGGHSSADDPAGVLSRTYDAGQVFFAKHGGSAIFELLCSIDIRTRQLAAAITRRRAMQETFHEVARHVRARRCRGSSYSESTTERHHRTIATRR
jgi:GT2 family glycosyltransferase